MSRAGRLKRKQAKARKAKKEVRKRTQRSTIKTILAGLDVAWRGVSWIWKVIAFLLVLVGAVATIYFFTWRLSVTPEVTLDESNPFSTLFVIQNDGQFSVYDVEFSCKANSVIYERNIRIEGPAGKIDEFNVPELAANAKTSTPCWLGIGFDAPVIKADISIVMEYRPKFYPLRKGQHFRFLGTRKSDGTYAWIPLAE